MRRLNNIPREVKRIALKKRMVFPARMGIGTDYAYINTGTPNRIWVTYEVSGIKAQVWNTHLPAKPGLRVLVGENDDYPGLLQVLRERLLPGSAPTVPLTEHHETHELYGDDEVRVYGGMVMPLNAVPISDTFVLKIQGAIVLTGTVWTHCRTQNVDLTSSVPTAGALWALLQVESDGTVTAKLSTPVTSKGLLTIAGIPLPDENCFPAWAVQLYDGQGTIRRNATFNDLFDLRWANGYLGGGFGTIVGDMTKVVYDTDDDGIVDNTNSIGGAAVENPLSPDVGNTIIWDGSKFVKGNPLPDGGTTGQVLSKSSDGDYDIEWSDPAGGGAGGDLVWGVEGALSVEDDVPFSHIITKDTTIEQVFLYCKEPGSAGSTIIDVLDGNGVSILQDLYDDRRPVLAYDELYGWVAEIPLTRDFHEGDILTLNIDQVATGASGMTVALQVGNGGISPQFNLTVEEADASPSVSNVDTIVFDGATVTDDGGGQVTVEIPAYVHPIYAAHVTRVAAQGLAEGDQVISFDTEVADDGAMFDAGNPTYLTCQKAGWYVITGEIGWIANTGNGRRTIIKVNSTTVVMGSVAASSTHNNPRTVCSIVYKLSVNDKIYLYGNHNDTGETINTTEAMLSAGYIGG